MNQRFLFVRGEGLGVKGRWWPVRQKKDGPFTTAAITCPKCGARGIIDDHTIEDDGMVNPSIVCPGQDEPCPFHEDIQLLGWEDK